jgi:hypothetical protein
MRVDPTGFDIPLNNRFEVVHPKDAGLASAKAVDCDEAVGRVLLIGGGPRCQMTARHFVRSLSAAAGLGSFPDEAYGTVPYCQDWIDTSESQLLLGFQRYTFEDYLEDMKREMGLKLHLLRVFRPVVRWYVLRQSPYYKAR